MSDDESNRRQFLRGLVTEEDEPRESDSSGDDHGWKPGFEPASKREIEKNRREVRQQLGEVEEPDEKPFDALDFLSDLDEEGDEEGGDADHNPRRRQAMALHRPPRALPEEEFLDACTRCEACVEACPHDAIELAGPRLRQAEGTPVINASKAPCQMCHDTPCVTACEPDALQNALGLSMGDARIQRHDCLAHQGGFCSTCVERCPVPGAIKVRDGKPTIRQGACTGCGVCHFVCPAPTNAVRIFPRGIPEEAR